jgi:uncharacterized RDD family membrane protein YckC
MPPPPPPAAPPPGQGWQSQPTPPGQPPAGGGMGSGMPSWTGNITARGTMMGPGGLALADIPDRLIALIIDAVILGVIGFVVSLVLGGIFTETRTDLVFGIPVIVRAPSLIGLLIIFVIDLVINAAYFIYQWSRMNGQTVGMRLMKVAVRDSATGGQVSQNQAITRWLWLSWPQVAYFVPFIGLIAAIVALVYYIYLLVTTAQDPMRQGLHDKQSKTVVAKLAM